MCIRRSVVPAARLLWHVWFRPLSSNNAGESWRLAGKGLRHSKVQSVTISRSERINGRGVVYAGIEPSAVFRSEDGGETWEECGGDGYFESRDGGDTWLRFEEGLQHRYLWSIAIDSADADNIILSAAASARRSHYEPAESYLYRRTAGSPWQQLRDGLPKPAGRRTAVLASHPREPGMFFAAWERDVYSVDGGARWCRLDVPWPKNCRINEICAIAIAEYQ